MRRKSMYDPALRLHVGAMDRATVAASEISHLNSTFHFVVDPSRA